MALTLVIVQPIYGAFIILPSFASDSVGARIKTSEFFTTSNRQTNTNYSIAAYLSGDYYLRAKQAFKADHNAYNWDIGSSKISQHYYLDPFKDASSTLVPYHHWIRGLWQIPFHSIFWLGFGGSIDDYHLINDPSSSDLSSSEYGHAFGTHYSLNISLSYDTRDRIFQPLSGTLTSVLLDAHVYHDTQNHYWTRTFFDYLWFNTPVENTRLMTRLFANIAWSAPAYYAMPGNNGSLSMKGAKPLRIRGHHFYGVQLDFEHHRLFGQFGGGLFCDIASLYKGIGFESDSTIVYGGFTLFYYDQVSSLKRGQINIGFFRTAMSVSFEFSPRY